MPAVNEISAEKMHSVHQGIRAVPTETSVVVAEYIIHTVC